MAALSCHPQARNAEARHDLRVRVVNGKSRFFARTWARYGLAQPGPFRLAPPPGRLPELKADYAEMRLMYISSPPPFADVIATLAELELRMNVKDS